MVKTILTAGLLHARILDLSFIMDT